MKGAANRLLGVIALRITRSRFAALAVILGILGLGLLAAMLVQPIPRTFAADWSSPREIAAVAWGHRQHAAIDAGDRVHLVWVERSGRRLVAYYGRLDRHGRWIDAPASVSDPQVEADDVALALTRDDAPLGFWIEKSGAGNTQRLMMARLGSGEPAQVLSTSPKIMRDLAVTQDEGRRVFLAWSDNRTGVYEVYLAGLDDTGRIAFVDRQVTDSGGDFLKSPLLAVGGDVVHLVYSADRVVEEALMHRTLSPSGEPGSAPQVLESGAQSAAQLGGQGGQVRYLVSAVADADGGLRVYDSGEGVVRQRTIDGDGRLVAAAQPLLTGGRSYSEVSAVRRGDQEWLAWAEIRPGAHDGFQVYVAAVVDREAIADATRVNYGFSDSLWPVMVVGSDGGRHVIWQQTAGPYAASLMYANDRDPAHVTAWQRLGFAREDGGWSFLVAVAQSSILAIITMVINVWRWAIVWAVTALGLKVSGRFDAVRRYSQALAWLVMLAALLLIVRPETKTLGQGTIAVASASHWVMGAFASAIALYLGRVWRESFDEVFIWAGIASVWLWCYYFMNLTLILREGFAP